MEKNHQNYILKCRPEKEPNRATPMKTERREPCKRKDT